MTFLHRYSVHHPYRTLAVAFLAVAAAVPGLARLRLRTDGHALVPADAPQVRLDEKIRAEFGLKDTIVLLVRSDDPQGIYNVHTLRLIDDLTQRLSRLPELQPTDVFSLATEKGHRVKQGTLQFLRFLDPMPDTTQQCATVRDDVRSIKVFEGTVVSSDEKSAAIFVGVPSNLDRDYFYRQIQQVIEGLGPQPERIALTGAPVAESLLGTHILEDLGVPTIWFGAPKEFGETDTELKAPRSLEELRLFIARHVGVLPIALVVMMLVFLVSFRGLIAAGLTLLKVGACLLMVFGLMGWMDVPIYLTIAVMPVILTATGVSDEVHIFDRYARQLRAHPEDSHVASLIASMDEMWRPVVMTSVTTAVGFLSFAISPLAPVRAFGVFTSIGSIVCMFWALTATPALAELVHPGHFRRIGAAADAHRHHGGFYRRWTETVIRRRGMILAATLVILAPAWRGVRRIRVQDSWIDGFSPASAFYRATSAFNDQFLGMHVLFVCADCSGKKWTGEVSESAVEHLAVRFPGNLADDPAKLVGCSIEFQRPGTATGPAASPARLSRIHRSQVESAKRDGDHILVSLVRQFGSPRFSLNLAAGERAAYRIASEPLMRPDVLQKIKALEEFIAGRRDERVGGTLGPARYLETTNFISQGRREEHRRIPEKEKVEWLWRWYESIRGAERRRATVDEDFSRGIISVFMKNANFVDTGRLLSAIRDYERANLTPHDIKLSFAGDVAVSQTLIDAIVTTQVRSLALSLVGVLVVCVVLSRSLGWGVYCVLPCLLAVPLNFAIMGWLGIPLGVATSMFASMTVGVGVDYAIHFIERYRLALRNCAGVDQALVETMQAAGPANVIDAVSVALGFGVLTLSQVPANARLGVMVVASIASCLAATLVLLPALLRIIGSRGIVLRGPEIQGTRA